MISCLNNIYLFKKGNGFTKFSLFDYSMLIRILLLNKISKAASKYAKGKLIDLGCGVKPYRELFLPYITEYIGVDHPDINKYHYNANDVELWEDCCKVSLENGYSDTIFSSQVLEHIEHPIQFVNEAYRLLKNGGNIIVTVSFLEFLHQPPYDYYRFTHFALKKLFKEAGFININIEPIGNANIVNHWTNIYKLKCKPNWYKHIYSVIIPFKNIINLLFYRKDDENCCVLYIITASK